ncbi:MAG: hypothetical protein V1793_14555, partial [Pseudomonadota bacterium]
AFATGQSTTLKKSHTRYTKYTYNNSIIFCEPYTVNKNDWLYKIFRKKGEIAETDFPLFIAIFRDINPQVSNIDAILPGQQILIPLKTVNPDDYAESSPGIVDVPVIEFASLPEKVKTFVTQHQVREGETVSQLVGTTFINPDGSLNPLGQTVFRLVNPTIMDPNLIYAGTTINLPSPALTDQTWFPPMLDTENSHRGDDKSPNPGPPFPDEKQPEGPATVKPAISIQDLSRYASTVNGTLVADGRLFFPGDTGRDLILDLTQKPLIKLKNGGRILIVSPENDDPELNRVANRFWPDLLIMDITRTLTGLPPAAGSTDPCKDGQTSCFLPRDHALAVRQLMAMTPFAYTPGEKIPISLGNLEINVTLDRIQRPEHPDLLLNFGTLYGDAVRVLQDKGMNIITVLPSEATLNMIARLSVLLDITITRDPAFVSPETRETIIIPGLYLSGMKKNLFISDRILKTDVAAFLDQKNVMVFYTWEAAPQGT